MMTGRGYLRPNVGTKPFCEGLVLRTCTWFLSEVWEREGMQQNLHWIQLVSFQVHVNFKRKVACQNLQKILDLILIIRQGSQCMLELIFYGC